MVSVCFLQKRAFQAVGWRGRQTHSSSCEIHSDDWGISLGTRYKMDSPCCCCCTLHSHALSKVIRDLKSVLLSLLKSFFFFPSVSEVHKVAWLLSTVASRWVPPKVSPWVVAGKQTHIWLWNTCARVPTNDQSSHTTLNRHTIWVHTPHTHTSCLVGSAVAQSL